MVAYLLLLVAVLSRVLPHAGWWNFTLVGGALLYFGAKRPWREMIAPLAALIATDCYVTVFQNPAFSIRWEQTVSWVWYVVAMALGAAILGKKVTLGRGVAAALLGPTSFFLISNFCVWMSGFMVNYPRTLAGLGACYMAAVPFYRNDVISTAVVMGAMFGVPVLVRRMQPAAVPVIAGK